MKNGWEVIIGMEIHAQLATETNEVKIISSIEKTLFMF